MKRPTDPLALDPRHRAALNDAGVRLARASAQAPREHVHRSRRSLRPGRASVLMLQAAVIAAVLTLGLWIGRPLLMGAWEQIVLWWAPALGIPLSLVDDGFIHQWVYGRDAQSLLPNAATGMLTAMGVIAAFASTWWMNDRLVPLKYLVRILCVIQASALLFFMYVPSLFPYTAGSHLSAVLESGYWLMLVLPGLLALGLGPLEMPAPSKITGQVLLLTCLALALPHKAVLHMLVLQHMSVLFMPLLYLCFGLAFDVMLIVALYSWLVSRVPARAVG